MSHPAITAEKVLAATRLAIDNRRTRAEDIRPLGSPSRSRRLRNCAENSFVNKIFAMPNGGPDNCANCGFNRRNRGTWRDPSPDEQELPFCEIRGVLVTTEHWTYCQNWHTRTRVPIGPVYASGLYEDKYRRIPWHGNIEPQNVESGVCSECRLRFEEGLQVAVVEGALMQFCCNRHYLVWWKKQHPNEDASMSRDIWEEFN